MLICGQDSCFFKVLNYMNSLMRPKIKYVTATVKTFCLSVIAKV